MQVTPILAGPEKHCPRTGFGGKGRARWRGGDEAIKYFTFHIRQRHRTPTENRTRLPQRAGKIPHAHARKPQSYGLRAPSVPPSPRTVGRKYTVPAPHPPFLASGEGALFRFNPCSCFRGWAGYAWPCTRTYQGQGCVVRLACYSWCDGFCLDNISLSELLFVLLQVQVV